MSICDSPPVWVIARPFITLPCPMKLTFRYNSVEFYSGVVLFSFIFRVTVTITVRVSYRVRVRV